MKIEKCEQETIILFNEEEETASVYSYNKDLKKKLDECCKMYPDRFQLNTQDKTGSKTYIVPKQYISVRIPRKTNNESLKNLRQNKVKNAS